MFKKVAIGHAMLLKRKQKLTYVKPVGFLLPWILKEDILSTKLITPSLFRRFTLRVRWENKLANLV